MKTKKLRVVADSSCLIALSQIGQFKLLKDIFSTMFIPEAVYKEVVVKGKKEPGAEETEEAISDGWIKRKSVKDKTPVEALSITLGRGESEVISLSKELKADFALIDEKTARDVAELMDVNTIGVIGIIDLAIKKQFDLDKRKLLDQLREQGFRISDELYREILSESNK